MPRSITDHPVERRRSIPQRHLPATLAPLLCLLGSAAVSPADQLAVGAASVDITPTGPVALVGQCCNRPARFLDDMPDGGKRS